MGALARQVAPSEALHAAVLQRLLLNLRLWAAAPLQVQRPFQAMLLRLARVGPFYSLQQCRASMKPLTMAESMFCKTPLTGENLM